MPIPNYLDFDLLLSPTDRGYIARILNSPAGEASIHFDLPFSPIELEEFLARMRRPKPGVPEVAAARAFGHKLYQTVFDDELEVTLRRSLDRAEQQQAGLRIRLRLDALAHLPWEFLYDKARNRFFALSAETPIVRYLELPEPPAPLPTRPPLHILVMIAAPPDLPPLDTDYEWSQLQQSLDRLLKNGNITLERLPNAQLPTLQQRLRQGDCHILHIIGHGEFEQATQKSALLLENEVGQSRPVDGELLGAILHDHDPLRLVVLNACQTGQAADRPQVDPFSGAAQRLVQQGIPAVLANQFKISDLAATTLTREFYAALTDGYPVDAALAEARKAIFALGDSVEWGTSLLFMRAPDGRIFDFGREDKDMADDENKQKQGDRQKAGTNISINIGGDVGGRVNVVGGDYTETHTGDQITVGDIIDSTGVAIGRNAQASVSQTTHTPFEEIRAYLEKLSIPADSKEEAAFAIKQLEKQNTDTPDVDKVDRWLDMLEKIAPDLVEVIVNALTNPGAAVGSGLRVAIRTWREARRR